MRAINFRLYSDLLGIRLAQLHLKTCLVFKCAIRKLFFCSKLSYLKFMMFLIERLLALNKLYDKFSGHKCSPVVDAIETPNQY